MSSITSASNSFPGHFQKLPPSPILNIFTFLTEDEFSKKIIILCKGFSNSKNIGTAFKVDGNFLVFLRQTMQDPDNDAGVQLRSVMGRWLLPEEPRKGPDLDQLLRNEMIARKGPPRNPNVKELTL